MKGNRNRFHSFTGGLIMLAIAGAQVGCGSEGPRSSSTEPPAFDVQGQSGEALFKGVFFGTGDVGRRLDGIWKGKTFADYVQSTDAKTLRQGAEQLRKDGQDKNAAELDKAADILSGEGGAGVAAGIQQAAKAFDGDAIAAAIAAQDPTFFARFQTEIRSGNQLRVSAIFKEGQEKIRGAFAADNGAGFVGGNSLAPKWCEYCYVDAFALAYVAAVAVAFVVVAAAAVVSPATGGEASELQNQMTVNYITQQLAL